MTSTESSILEILNDPNSSVAFKSLSPDEASALECAVDNGWAERRVEYKDNNLLEPITVYRITASGRVALENEHAQKRRRRKEDIRYWITTAIAIAALIVALLK